MAAADAPRRDGRPAVAGVILAAGGSTRMGCAKQLLPLGGRPVLQHVIDAAVASGLGDVVLVLGDRAAEVRARLRLSRARVRVVVNRDWAAGQSGSLRAGLRAAGLRAEAAAILLGDQPSITPGLVDRVVAAFHAGGLPVARPVYGHGARRRVPGHPVVLARRLWPEVEKLTGDEGARRLLEANPAWVLEVPVEGERPADLDTWADYARAVGAAARPETRRSDA
jgi:molybdenum cofactor cytidylyltransferase